MKYLLLPLLLILFILNTASAQTGTANNKSKLVDSLRKAGMTEAAVRNPLLRQASFSTDFISRSTIKSDLNGNRNFEGKVSQFRTSSLINIPVTNWGKNSIGASFLAFQQNANFSDITSSTPGLTSQALDYNKLSLGITVSFSRRDSLFGKPVFYTASISGTSDNVYSVKKMSYLAGAAFIVKQSANTRITVGALLNIDPALSVPVIPIISYWHRFDNELEFTMNLPSQLGVRKQFTKRLSANFGTSLTGSIAFFNAVAPGVPQNVNYTTVDLKTGPGVEYRFARKLIFGVNGGLFNNLSSKAYDRNLKASDYFLKNKLGGSTYLNFTLAILPFL